jgi:hypothetical protein
MHSEPHPHPRRPSTGIQPPFINAKEVTDTGRVLPLTPLDMDSDQRKNKPSEMKYSANKVDARNELDDLRGLFYAVEGFNPGRKENMSADLYLFALRYLR